MKKKRGIVGKRVIGTLVIALILSPRTMLKTNGNRMQSDCIDLGTDGIGDLGAVKSGHSDNRPAWIGYVTPSKTGRTLYFNGRALMKSKGQRRGESGGNYVDMETGESFWVSGVKKKEERWRPPLGWIREGSR